jgi:hypothetical protein
MHHIASLIEFLFGCHHRNLSHVFTISQHTYRVCWDCGAEFDYSWETMSSQPGDITPVWKFSSE